jgi:hypothetical protein
MLQQFRHAVANDSSTMLRSRRIVSHNVAGWATIVGLAIPPASQRPAGFIASAPTGPSTLQPGLVGANADRLGRWIAQFFWAATNPAAFTPR